MVIHVTREIGQVAIFGANGNEALLRNFFEQQECRSEIARRPFELDRLSHEELRKKLLVGIQSLTAEENVELFIH